MELKLDKRHMGEKRVSLLIVPYGIETGLGKHGKKTGSLLIVPYGIETKNVQELESFLGQLLIVPYGIETCFTATSGLPCASF